MGKKEKVQPYNNGIEEIIIENIQSSKKEISIAMAWFTSNEIKNALIDLKDSNPSVDIQIVVDDNSINNKYFFNYIEKFQETGIIVHKKKVSNFLHHKFMVIDNKITLTGSYNYSKKARTNKENIVVIRSKKVSSAFSRTFRFLTEENYIDANIKLLFKYPEFAQQLLSTYYKFTQAEFRKYKPKIEYGNCDTVHNGMNDDIVYSSGFIFNPRVTLATDIDDSEFPLPVNKDSIKDWMDCRNFNMVLDSYRDTDNIDDYKYMDVDLKENKSKLEKFFKRKIKNTYKSSKIEKLIKNNVDIIIEDRLWCDNFELYLNKKIVDMIFNNIQVVEKPNNIQCSNDLPF